MDYTFEGQRADEDVVFAIKRHPWILAKRGFVAIGLIILLILFFLFFGFSSFAFGLIIALICFFVIYGLYAWFVYNNHLYILTNQRVIIIEQGGIFHRKITEAELDKIQNITIEIRGPMRTLLNFGDCVLRTAGMEPSIILKNIENPYEVQQKIIKYCKGITKSS